MKGSLEQYGRRVMSGRERTAGAAVLRALLAAVEPLYAAAVSARNGWLDRGVGVRRLPASVVSVGNITAGGTGKTPVVLWLCSTLRAREFRPAVLLRGYKADSSGRSDEAELLNRELNAPVRGGVPSARVPVGVNPDRYSGGLAVLRHDPHVNVFVLDDGFQHRKLARQFELVLIDAAEPFGYGHVHPRGLLREPLRGLRRADAVLLTRADTVDAGRRAEIEATIRRYHPGVPIYHASHEHAGFRVPAAEGDGAASRPLEAIAGWAFFAFCGIGSPETFFRQAGRLPGKLVGSYAFGDHHAYDAGDLETLRRRAAECGAEVLLTTEKDWVKLAALPGVAAGGAVPGGAATAAMPVWRAELALTFRQGDEERLLGQILDRVTSAQSGGHRED